MFEKTVSTVKEVAKEVEETTTEVMKAVKFVWDPEGFMVPVWMERKSLMADVK